jgi:hypothetical protein
MFSSMILSDFSSQSSINPVFNHGLLNNLKIQGVFFCNMAVMYQTLSFSVYGFFINVHQITIVFPAKSLVLGFALQYRANNFSHHLI